MRVVDEGAAVGGPGREEVPHRQLPGQAGLGCHRWSGQVDRRQGLHFGEPVVRRPVGHPVPQHHGQVRARRRPAVTILILFLGV